MNWKQALTNLNPFKQKQEATEPDIPKEVEPKHSRKKIYLTKDEKESEVKELVNEVTWKLTEEQKLIIINMLGRCMSPAQIAKEVFDEHGIKISTSMVYKYSIAKKWRPLIKKFREEYLANISEVAGAHKRVRLDRADRLYKKAEDKGDIKAALGAIEHSRREMEEKVAASSLNLTLNQYNLMTDEELEYRKQELLQKLDKSKKVIEIKPMEDANGLRGV